MTPKRPSKAQDKALPRSQPTLQPMNLILGPVQVEIVATASIQASTLGFPIMREGFVTSTGILNK